MLGLPIQEVAVDAKGRGPRVVVYDEELVQRPGQLVKESDIAKLACVAVSGLIAEADAYGKDEIHAVFQKYGIVSPETKNPLTEPMEFNLMFPTPIGPVGNLHGYLRPETAQGIFLNFKFCLEQNAGSIPFGVAQVCV